MTLRTEPTGVYENVLVPTDGSDNAERGIAHAIDLAAETGAHLHVLFVVDETVYGSDTGLSSYEAYIEKVADDAEDLVESVVEEATERGVESTTSVLRGTPHEEILDYAEAQSVDLIVMGKRGATGGTVPHVGSVTDRVLRGATVPVMPV